MSQQAMQKQQRGGAVANNRPTVDSLLSDPKFKQEMARALPKHMTPDRMLRIVMTEIRKNDKLRQADPFSFMGAIMQASQLGLEPGSGLGHAYLVPYWSKALQCFEVNMITGYKGLADLARRSGQIKAVWGYCIYDGDFFDEGVRSGIPYLDYKSCGEDDPNKIVGAFSIAQFNNNATQWQSMTRAQIERIRDGGNKNPVWDNHFDEMARKTPLRRLAKLLPLSPELATGIELDDADGTDQSQRSHALLIEKGLLESSYQPAPAATDEATSPGEVSREQERASDQRAAEDLRTELNKRVGDAVRAGETTEAVFKRCGLRDKAALQSAEAPVLVAALEALKAGK